MSAIKGQFGYFRLLAPNEFYYGYFKSDHFWFKQ